MVRISKRSFSYGHAKEILQGNEDPSCNGSICKGKARQQRSAFVRDLLRVDGANIRVGKVRNLLINRLLGDRNDHVVPTGWSQWPSSPCQAKINSYPEVKMSVSFILSRCYWFLGKLTTGRWYVF